MKMGKWKWDDRKWVWKMEQQQHFVIDTGFGGNRLPVVRRSGRAGKVG